MPCLAPLDVEEALRVDVATMAAAHGIALSTCAPPVPETLGDTLPMVMFSRVGGFRTSVVVDRHDMSIDVWAGSGDDYATAMAAANQACALCAGLPEASGLAHPWHRVSIMTLPYANPDDRHPTIPRVTFMAHFITRAVEL